MKKINLFVLMFVMAIFLSITTLSQLGPITNMVSKISQATPAISLEEKESCITSFYDETKNVFGNCVYYHNYTSCLNTSGANTDCSLKQSIRNFACKTSEFTITKNATECKPLNKFIISINKGPVVEKKEVDFSGWGVCVQSTEDDCLAVTCGTLKGGSARNGIFNGCDGGKSCQKFLFCEDGVKVLYKASRNDFVEYDPTFHLPQLALKEVGQ